MLLPWASQRLLRRSPSLVASTLASSLRCHRHASRLRVRIPPPFPVVECCASPTCAYRPAPTGLDIDHEQPLNGTMAAYAEQVLISTGRGDWSSRIEEEEDAVLARGLKDLLGRNGKFSNVRSTYPRSCFALEGL